MFFYQIWNQVVLEEKIQNTFGKEKYNEYIKVCDSMSTIQ